MRGFAYDGYYATCMPTRHISWRGMHRDLVYVDSRTLVETCRADKGPCIRGSKIMQREE
jgi:hypothetical protein